MGSFLGQMKKPIFIVIDAMIMTFTIIFAFYLRLGWPLSSQYLDFLQKFLVPFMLLKLSIFYGLGMYRRLWRYASVQELRVIAQSVVLASFTVLFLSYSLGTIPIPRSVFIVDGLLTLFMIGGLRFFGRIFAELRGLRRMSSTARRELIVGAGSAGGMLAKEMLKSSSLQYLPVGFVDDDKQKQGQRLHGIKVLGKISEIKDIIGAGNIDEVIIAMPSVSRQVKEDVVNICKQMGVRCRTLPGIYEIIDGHVGIGQIRDIQIEDILGRDPVTVNLDEIGKFVEGSVVLVTGAGGSIGSELCRQVAGLRPELLVMVDIAENSLFEIEQALLETNLCPIVAAIGDVKDRARVDELLELYHPKVIFHAAAYKHVPLMEANPKAALENNFLGTAVLAEASAYHNVAKFVLISTDKAVNPTSVMGMTKALAEMVVSSIDGASTVFIVVRFGNVLASRGSVVPIFQKQINNGGPITITHPKMKRYLMTITESVQLVLQAAVFGSAGEVYLLDMGEQVSIVELAEKLVELSGLNRDQIPIEYIGIRPGEKIEEELMSATETTAPSPHSKIIKLVDSREKPTRVALLNIEKLVRAGEINTVFAEAELLTSSEQSGKATAATH